MKKILLVEGNLKEANQEFTENGIKTHTESLQESISYYTNNLESLAALREPVDIFFDHVLVQDENEKIRQNRLALINKLIIAMDSAADFSLIE